MTTVVVRRVKRVPSKTLSYRVGERVVRLVAPVLARVEVSGAENLPREGACIVVSNHTTHADPFFVAQVMTGLHRLPRFLAKASILDLPVIGPILTRAGQIPVYRESTDALAALAAADDALRAGECVVIYPEGTLTRDPQLWPMRAKLGAARLALSSSAPVVPLVHWGSHHVLPPYGRVPKVLPRRRVRVLIGSPVDLSAFVPRPGEQPDLKDVMRANLAIERALVELVAQLRDEPAPAMLWNPRAHGQAVVGNPQAHPRVRRAVFARRWVRRADRQLHPEQQELR